MSLGRSRSIALVGLTGVPIDVEADVVSGLPAIRLVGLADRAVNEAIDRVRSAVTNSGFAFPAQRVTISLSPAALPKSGSSFDLPIAMACLASLGLVTGFEPERTVYLGELSLDGRLRPTAGILPAVLAARTLGVDRVVVPLANLAEARLVSGISAVGVASLREAVEPGGGAGAILHANEVDVITQPPPTPGDLADVIGVETAVEALIVAAVGGHNMFMVGPPGAGKTMLASRLPGILPPLSEDHALEVAAISSLVDGARRKVGLDFAPPFEAPHHTLSAAGICDQCARLPAPAPRIGTRCAAARVVYSGISERVSAHHGRKPMPLRTVLDGQRCGVRVHFHATPSLPCSTVRSTDGSSRPADHRAPHEVRPPQ